MALLNQMPRAAAALDGPRASDQQPLDAKMFLSSLWTNRDLVVMNRRSNLPIISFSNLLSVRHTG
jgi:hypothetical protein